MNLIGIINLMGIKHLSYHINKMTLDRLGMNISFKRNPISVFRSIWKLVILNTSGQALGKQSKEPQLSPFQEMSPSLFSRKGSRENRSRSRSFRTMSEEAEDDIPDGKVEFLKTFISPESLLKQCESSILSISIFP